MGIKRDIIMFDEYKKEMTRNSAKLIIITTITSLLIAVTSFIGPLLKVFIKSWGKLWFSGINWKSNYKSLVDLFKGRGCGQSPQILSVYAI